MAFSSANQAQHPAFPLPRDADTNLWRYLDFAKFDWLVLNQRLFMPNAAHLGDPLEGTQPSGDNDWWISLLTNAQSEEERKTIEHNRQLISGFTAAFRTRYYVSCWHMNSVENAAMWKTYTTSSESVAIQTTHLALRNQLPAYVEIGVVRYLDYAKERLPTLNVFEYITHKDKSSFEYENELRAVAMHPVVEGVDQTHFREHHFQLESAANFLVYAPPVDIRTLIKAIVLHPQASKEFSEKIAASCIKYGLPKPQRSNIEHHTMRPNNSVERSRL